MWESGGNHDDNEMADCLLVITRKIFHNLLTATIIAVKGPANVSPTMQVWKFVHIIF